MSKTAPFKYFKTSPEIIKLAVMYYIRFPLSLRQVEDILHERGIDITHETIRFWWNRFGPLFAKEIRKNKGDRHSNWRWHIDEVFVKINGERFYLWRAVDQEGTVLESFVSKRRDRRAALKVLRKLLSKHGSPHEIITDKLGSYRAALRELNLLDRHETGQYENNQSENSHLHFRQRERAMCRFRSARSLQKFISINAAIFNHFSHQRHFLSRPNFKLLRDQSLADWRKVCAG
ncbi:IS6 family transposase [Pacificibacter marinus]|uniref:IS6 family transposase n=1 Tax=Pacificibacter marinus TaxID=658057 RepID=UPI001C069760|nr:IS6 family transposase [Pacificibacter marinus]MBU2868416.1 IS6 family transposase [Pacificibacter marinus]